MRCSPSPFIFQHPLLKSPVLSRDDSMCPFPRKKVHLDQHGSSAKNISVSYQLHAYDLIHPLKYDSHCPLEMKFYGYIDCHKKGIANE